MFWQIFQKRYWLLPAALALMVVLSACGTATTPPPAPEPSASAQATVTESPTVTAVPVATVEAPTPTLEPQMPSASVSFTADVLPILQDRCINCHGGQRTSADLDLKTYATLMAGSEDGAVVIPGDAANSPLVTLAESGKMPKRGPKLTPEQIQILKDWVNAGAPNN